jgi:hypothetical protein
MYKCGFIINSSGHGYKIIGNCYTTCACFFFLAMNRSHRILSQPFPVHAYCSPTPVSFLVNVRERDLAIPASQPISGCLPSHASLSPLPPSRANPALPGHPCGSPVLPWPNCYPPSPAANGGPTASLLRPYACLPAWPAYLV